MREERAAVDVVGGSGALWAGAAAADVVAFMTRFWCGVEVTDWEVCTVQVLYIKGNSFPSI